MATFLQLCQRVRQECGVAGDGPSSTVNQVGVLKKIVDRTSRAWVDIQASRPYWKFLRNQLTFPTVVGQREYSVATDLLVTTIDKFDRANTYLYLLPEDEVSLKWVDYAKFRSTYRGFTSGRPTVLTESPGRTLTFNRTPDAIYTATIDYWMTPEQLSAVDDVPSCPEHYHDAIVWKSVMMFAGNEGAAELYAYAKGMYTPISIQLILDQGEMPAGLASYPLTMGSTAGRRGF